jgi:hypothetical protein
VNMDQNSLPRNCPGGGPVPPETGSKTPGPSDRFSNASTGLQTPTDPTVTKTFPDSSAPILSVEAIIAQDRKRNQSNCYRLWWERSGINPRYVVALQRQISDRGGSLTEAIARCQGFVSEPKQRGAIYLSGGVGCGKTLLACKMLLLAATNWMAQITESRWEWPCDPPAMELHSVPSILTTIRGTFNGNGSSTALINRYAKLHWLALDDVGAEKPSEWVCDVLFQIIDDRYSLMLPTIFTSNLSLDQLSDRLSERIADRILEMCRGNVIQITVGSYRG